MWNADSRSRGKGMKRRLFNILSALSLLLCVATLAMWGIAQRVQHLSSYHHIERHGAVVQVDAGAWGWGRSGLFTWQRDTNYLYGQTYDRDFHPQGQATDQDIAEAIRMADNLNSVQSMGGLYGRALLLHLPDSRFHVLTTYNRLTVYERSGTWLAVPFYQMATLALLLPLAWLATWAVRRQRRLANHRPGLCLACGYDLRAGTDRCPECGNVIPKPPVAGTSAMKRMPPEKAKAEAKQNPGGWVYEIRGYYGPDDPVPPQAVVGAWTGDDQGEIVGEFIPNPNFNEAA